MPNTKQGAITATWVPDKPADALAQSPNTLFSVGNLRNRIEVGFNNPCAIPGTVLLYDFTDRATTLYDKSGFQRNGAGTSIDTALYEETLFGTGYNFPGAADYFSVAEFPRIDEDILTGLTIEVIVKIDDDSGSLSIIDKTTTGGQSYRLWINAGIPTFVTNGITNPNLPASNVLSTDRYYHIAGIYDNVVGRKLYIDGRLDIEDSNVGTITTSSGYDIKIGSLAGTSQFFNGTIVAIRICNRALDPSEFMHHYYLKTLVNGYSGGNSVLFDESLSTFPKRKSVIITANWKKDLNQEWATLLVQTKKGTPGEIQVPEIELGDVYSGGLPEVDKYTVGYWVFNGISASKNGTTGLVRDWSGNEHHATLVSLSAADLVKTRFDKYYDLDGSADYYTVPHSDQLNPEMQNFTIEALVRNDYFDYADQQDYFRKYNGSGSEFVLQYDQPSNYIRMYIEDDSANTADARGTGLSNYVDKNGWYHITASVNRETNICTLMVDGRVLDEKDISTVTGPIGNSNTLYIGRRGDSVNKVYGPIAYIRYSIGIARTPDEMRFNAMNFNSRANGIVQDLLVE